MSNLNKQVGGNHYKEYAIQPWEYMFQNNIGYFEGEAIAYITRWKDKNGIDDLKKAVHTLEGYIELLERRLDKAEKD